MDTGFSGTGSSGTLAHYLASLCSAPEVGMTLDLSLAGLTPEYLTGMAGPVASAAAAMDALESGAVANATENRMVGHYWLRAPDLAPTPEIGRAIDGEVAVVEGFAHDVRRGAVGGAGGPFEHVVHVGIGGSALGPQLICDALGADQSRPQVHFLDNADPDGVDRLLRRLDGRLGQTLVSIVSKSGWTPTPMQVLRELEHAYEQAGVSFAPHVVATTMAGTELDVRANEDGWLACFRLWPWVGGRTSVTSSVGLLPAAVLGVDIRAFLRGAATMDRVTRRRSPSENPAVLLALAWYWLGGGRGEKDMVVLPYKDRLCLFPRYVQQLVMESVGKKVNRRGEVVHQGMTVYGNKGSTDQHAYVQQLRDGPPNFFATFIHVAQDRMGPSCEVTPGVTLGDYLLGHLEGTRAAFHERGRASITISLADLGPASLGALIALYERAVGFYAELVDVNAYDQPGVDKDAAGGVVALQRLAMSHLRHAPTPQSIEDIADSIGRRGQEETLYKVLAHLASEPGRGVVRLDAGEANGEGGGCRFTLSGEARTLAG